MAKLEQVKAVEPWSCENAFCGVDIDPGDIFYRTPAGKNICESCAEDSGHLPGCVIAHDGPCEAWGPMTPKTKQAVRRDFQG